VGQRVSFTRVTLEYFEVDLGITTISNLKLALMEIKQDPARHQLGNTDQAYICTEVKNMKRKHWTQTAKGRAHLRRMLLLDSIASLNLSRRRLLMARSHRTSRTSTDEQKEISSITRFATTYLSPLLPEDWQRYFNPRRAGKNWGIEIKCPTCGDKPPTTYYDKKLRTNRLLSHYRRLRWMMVHIAKHKPVRLG
jgi:hypothetical protein